MAQYSTHKSTSRGKAETLERRAIRANKAGAARLTSSGRARKAV